MYRYVTGALEFLLVHPGGPFWAGKEDHSWSLPKGEIDEAEEIEKAARREFYEETGMPYEGSLTLLPRVKASGSKVIHPFLGKGDFDTSKLHSNTFELEWPPNSGRMQKFPEVDKAGWFTLEIARDRIHKGQIHILDLAVEALNK